MRFLRKQEYFSAESMGFVVALHGFAMSKLRQLGSGMASGMWVGGDCSHWSPCVWDAWPRRYQR